MQNKSFITDGNRKFLSFLSNYRHSSHRKGNMGLLEYCKAINNDLYAEGKIRSWKKYCVLYGKLEQFLLTYSGYGNQYFPLKRIDKTFIMDFDTYLRSTPLHPNSINVNMSVLQTIVNRAFYVDNAIPGRATPFQGYIFRQLKSYREVLAPDEIQMLGKLSLKEGSSLWNARNAFMFSYFCAGIRVGDLLKLKWSNVISGERLVYVMSKNLKHRDLLLVKPALDILSHYPGQKSDFIFPYLDNTAPYALLPEKALSPHQKIELVNDISSATKKINRALGRLCNMAGIDKHVTMHVSRHSFASLAREKGVMSAEIKDLLAHSNLRTTEIYMGDFDRQKSDDILQNLFE